MVAKPDPRPWRPMATDPYAPALRKALRDPQRNLPTNVAQALLATRGTLGANKVLSDLAHRPELQPTAAITDSESANVIGGRLRAQNVPTEERLGYLIDQRPKVRTVAVATTTDKDVITAAIALNDPALAPALLVHPTLPSQAIGTVLEQLARLPKWTGGNAVAKAVTTLIQYATPTVADQLVKTFADQTTVQRAVAYSRDAPLYLNLLAHGTASTQTTAFDTITAAMSTQRQESAATHLAKVGASYPGIYWDTHGRAANLIDHLESGAATLDDTMELLSTIPQSEGLSAVLHAIVRHPTSTADHLLACLSATAFTAPSVTDACVSWAQQAPLEEAIKLVAGRPALLSRRRTKNHPEGPGRSLGLVDHRHQIVAAIGDNQVSRRQYAGWLKDLPDLDATDLNSFTVGDAYLHPNVWNLLMETAEEQLTDGPAWDRFLLFTTTHPRDPITTLLDLVAVT